MRTMFLCLVLLALTGCGSGDAKRFDVSGTVTYAGQPVTTGVVYFDPDYTKGSDGVQGYAEIVDGRFSTRDSGRGLGGGKYLVRIRGYGSAAPGTMPAPLFDEHTTAAEVPKASDTLAFDLPRTAKNTGPKLAVEIP